MRRLRLAVAVASLMTFVSPAMAQNEFKTPTQGKTVVGFQIMCQNPSGQAIPCGDATTPLQITGTFSAALGGFTPSASGARGTPVAVTTGDSSGTLPTGTVVDVSNVGSNPMYCNVNGVAATTADKLIASNSWFEFTIPAGVTVLHCIATGGSTAANTVGGSGLGTGAGGGSSGGGGGGAITAAVNSYAAGALSSGAGVDGWDLTQGTKADSAYAGSGSASEIAALKGIYTIINTLNTTAQAPPPLSLNGTNTAWTGLTPGVAQTGTIVAANIDNTSQGGVAFGAMANYGTSPGAVKVAGVNAFITNTPAVTVSGVATAANQIVGTNYGNQANWVTNTSGNVANTAQTQILPAPVAGKLYVTGVQCFNSGSTASTITLNDNAATVLLNPAGIGVISTFLTPLTVTTTTALKFTPGSSSTNQWCNAQAYNAS